MDVSLLNHLSYSHLFLLQRLRRSLAALSRPRSDQGNGRRVDAVELRAVWQHLDPVHQTVLLFVVNAHDALPLGTRGARQPDRISRNLSLHRQRYRIYRPRSPVCSIIHGYNTVTVRSLIPLRRRTQPRRAAPNWPYGFVSVVRESLPPLLYGKLIQQ